MDKQSTATARPAAPPPDPCTRGLAVETCDLGHQAIAFAGTCPICRRRARGPQQGVAPMEEGHLIYARDLDRLLQRHYGAGGAGARQA